MNQATIDRIIQDGVTAAASRIDELLRATGEPLTEEEFDRLSTRIEADGIWLADDDDEEEDDDA